MDPAIHRRALGDHYRFSPDAFFSRAFSSASRF
jgi:hypothetical protein